MPILVPNAASSLSTSGSIPNSANQIVWYGLRAGSVAASVTWYQGNSAISGSELMSISLSPMQQVLFGPFSSPCGLFAASISGGSALYQVRL